MPCGVKSPLFLFPNFDQHWSGFLYYVVFPVVFHTSCLIQSKQNISRTYLRRISKQVNFLRIVKLQFSSVIRKPKHVAAIKLI
jgi:hypothetical protein